MSGLLLYVLAGANAGAACRLHAGDHLIGASEQCDFVLADALVRAEHVRLHGGDDESADVFVLAEGVYLDGEPLAAGAELTLPLIAPLQIGGTLLAVGRDDTDWTSIPASRLAIKMAPPASESEASAPAVDDEQIDAADDLSPENAQPAEKNIV